MEAEMCWFHKRTFGAHDWMTKLVFFASVEALVVGVWTQTGDWSTSAGSLLYDGERSEIPSEPRNITDDVSSNITVCFVLRGRKWGPSRQLL